VHRFEGAIVDTDLREMRHQAQLEMSVVSADEDVALGRDK